VFSSKFKVLVLSLMVLGAATSAYACGDEKKETSQASMASADGCAGKMSKAACAAKMAAGECKGAKGANVSLVAMGGDHCAAGKSTSKSASMANCTYGENTVTFAGACAVGNDADYSFAIAGAECQGTGTAAAKAIKSLKGVASVTVDYDKHMAYVCADKRAVNQKTIAKQLKNAGFDEVKFVSASKENCAKSHGKIDA
jgi:copper chaperone CopZ